MTSDPIEKYSPKVSVDQNFQIDETLEDKELTFVCFEKLKLARTVQDAVFIVIGRLLKLTRDRKLYHFLDFDNFEQFLASEELSFSREKAYAYIRIYELYVERLKLPMVDIQKLGVARLMLMSPIIKDIENDEEAIEKIDSMKDIRYSDFVRQVKEQKNIEGKPSFYWSEEQQKWIIQYYEDTSSLKSLGLFANKDV